MPTKRKLLNSQEAAEYLGFSISYFRKMMMKSVRISSQSEIDSEAARYLANNRKPV